MVWFSFFSYLLIGAIAGCLSGMLGIGGGLIVVPALIYVFQYQSMPANAIMHMAAGTSLAAMVLTTASSSFAHHRHSTIDWQVWRRLMPGILVGVVCGAALARIMSTSILQFIFAIFLLVISIHLFLNRQPSPKRTLPSFVGTSSVSLLIGAKSGMFGLGGGAIIIPFLLYCNIPIQSAAGISVACGFPVAIVGSMSIILMSYNIAGLPEYSLGYVYLPAAAGIAISSIFFSHLGVRLAHTLPTKLLKRIFAVMLFFSSVDILMDYV